MDSLQSLDIALFRFVNLDLRNRFFDWFLPFFNSSPVFVPALAVLAIALLWKGGARARLLVFFLLLTLLIGDPLVIRSLKHLFSRPRPFITLHDIHVFLGKVDSGSMPSGHSANWFAAMTVGLAYYRRSVWFMLPMALIEAFSRVYLGVHYPSDVLVGGLLGITYATIILWLSDALWQFAGSRWFPLWWIRVPYLLQPDQEVNEPPGAQKSPTATTTLDQHWVRLAYVLIGLLLAGHLIYLGSQKIDLSEDEAYQWLWSKHLALSYYSKPPLIAYTQFLGTQLWGDTEFGIRFFSPVIGAVASILLVRFLAREANGRVACLMTAVASATPLLMVGATLMTIDCSSVLFWVAAMIAGWRAVQRDSTVDWVWTGLWMGLGFLSKYVALVQWLSWAMVFALWPHARAQLRRPGPYLALLVNALCLLPVLVWNMQNHWITVAHLANRGGLDRSWEPTLRFVSDFFFSEAFLFNPIFFAGVIWAACTFWSSPLRTRLMDYAFAMGAPLFIVYFLFSFRSRVQPNWIAPSVLPLFCMMLVYFEAQWRKVSKDAEGALDSPERVHRVITSNRQGRFRVLPTLLTVGLILGWIVIVPLHDTRLIGKVTGYSISWKLDPLTRVLGWKETAAVVSQARTELLAEGKPVFIIGGHYGITSLLSFYIRDPNWNVRDRPLVYCQTSEQPENQFYFWPGYQARHGENAIYATPVDRPESTIPPYVRDLFTSVTDLGTRDVMFRGTVYHRIHLFACRNLR